MKKDAYPSAAARPAETETLSRGDFMRSLGLNTAALMTFYCLGTSLAACKKEESVAPTPTSGVTGNATAKSGTIDFSLDLTNSSISSLTTKGNALKVGDVFVANAKSGYIALQRFCTHEQQDALIYQAGSDNIQCTAHGSLFTTSGAVQQGPATSALKRYTATLSADGKTLAVKA